MNPISLTERRKADRILMAELTRKLAESLGATVVDKEPFRPNQIVFEIHHKGGAYLPLEFCGKSCQPDVHVSCWNVRSDCPTCFADSFADSFDGINPYHHRKCTVVAHGLNDLLMRLTCDLKKLNNGRGYSKERTEAFAKEYAHRFVAVESV